MGLHYCQHARENSPVRPRREQARGDSDAVSEPKEPGVHNPDKPAHQACAVGSAERPLLPGMVHRNVAADGGGCRAGSGLWASLSRDERDALVAFGMHQLSRMIGTDATKLKMQRSLQNDLDQ